MIRLVICATAILLSACSHANADWNATIAASNPLNWYRLDEHNHPSQPGIAHDSGSQGLNGTYGGEGMFRSPFQGVPGLVGSAVEFASVNDTQGMVLNGADLTGDWSAEFVAKKTRETESQVLLGEPPALGAHYLKLEQWQSTHQLGYTEAGRTDFLFSPPASAPLGQFVDVVFVNDSNGVQLYINGILKGSNSKPIPLPRHYIGSIGNRRDNLFAVLDEVVIYNRALSPAEIASHFASIPEPSTLLLAIASLAAMPTRRRNSRRADKRSPTFTLSNYPTAAAAATAMLSCFSVIVS